MKPYRQPNGSRVLESIKTYGPNHNPPKPWTLIPHTVLQLQGEATVTGDPAQDLPKARALGSALLVFTLLPWTLCLLLYSGA